MPRIVSDDQIEYKEKKVKGLLDRVTATLSGTRSGIYTRIANRYKRIDVLIDKLQEQRNRLNEQVKEHVVDLFDAEDECLTRVVETVSLTVTLSKRTPAGSKEISDFDTEGFLEELYSTFPDLEKQLNYLKDKYTTLETVEIPEKSPALRVKLNEDHNENVADKLEDYSDLVYQKVMKGLESFDRKLAHIKSNI